MGNWCANKEDLQKNRRNGEFQQTQPNPEKQKEIVVKEIKDSHQENQNITNSKNTFHAPPPPTPPLSPEPSQRVMMTQEKVIPPPPREGKDPKIHVPTKSPTKNQISAVLDGENDIIDEPYPLSAVTKPSKKHLKLQEKREDLTWKTKTSGYRVQQPKQYNTFDNQQQISMSPVNPNSESSFGHYDIRTNSNRPNIPNAGDKYPKTKAQ